MTIPPFALDFGHIITSVTDTALLLNNDQQRNIEMIIQSSLNDFLTDSSLIGGATFTTASITSVKYTTATFLTQSTDTNSNKHSASPPKTVPPNVRYSGVSNP
ncbi:hypothetical protein QTG54_009161 [Skeletonema marinoi]|uniref:Uncharacterized protein n=1 Tax=Skeletonema marinoi TaxID=267567 RepID=A0AAD8Y5R1_9STRA|nr:hypothetical protein QTG54_009161 [Skeletonema marinoi]